MRLKNRVLLAASLFGVVQQASLAQHARNGSAPASVPPAHVVVRTPAPNLGGRPYPIRRDIPTPTGLIAPAASYTGITPGALRPLGNRGGHGNSSVGYGGFYGTPYLPYMPYLDTSPVSTFPGFSEQAEAISAQANAQMQDAVAQQMEQMSSEIRQLRENQMQSAQAQGSQMQQQPQWVPPPAASTTAAAQPPQAPIVVILQSGARLSVANYAVMNGNLWDFSKQPARKIPLSTVNVTASEKATEESGGEFPQISSTPNSAR